MNKELFEKNTGIYNMSLYPAQHVLSKCFKNKTNRLSANNLYSVQDYLNAVYDEENDALRICFDGNSPDGGGINIFIEGYAKKEDGVIVAFYSDEEFENILNPNSEQFYVDINTDAIYRWNGFNYIGISSVELGNTSGTAYPGEKGKELEKQIEKIENAIKNQFIIVSNSTPINLENRQTAICVVENCSLNLPDGNLGGIVKIYLAKGSSVTINSKNNLISSDQLKSISIEQELTYLLLIFDVNSNTWYFTYTDIDSHLVL